MGYSEDEAMVRVDFFKDSLSLKWYTTEAVRMKWSDGDIYTAFNESLRDHLAGRLNGMLAVCLEPHHPHPFPIIARVNS